MPFRLAQPHAVAIGARMLGKKPANHTKEFRKYLKIRGIKTEGGLVLGKIECDETALVDGTVS
jgi:hypothetical protein